MSEIARALTRLYADPNLTAAALWRAGGAGPGVALRVARAQPDDVVGFGQRQILVERREVRLLVSAAPTLAAGDTIEIDGEELLVVDPPRRDETRLVWTVTLGPKD